MNMFRSLRRTTGADARLPPLAEADAARDAGRWAEAARAYRAHLVDAPADAAAWVQLGHALKETGELEEARDAYERASAHAPADPDPHLHRAHLLKRMDRPRQAELAFLELMRLAPAQRVLDELNGLGFGPPAGALAAAASRSTFIEVKDLLLHVEHHATLTGISRVVLGLVHHVLEEMDEGQASGFRFVWGADDGDGMFGATHSLMRRIVRAVLDGSGTRDAVAPLVAEARRAAQPVALGRGDVYLMPGAFWLSCADPGRLAGLKREGVVVGAYLYDLIPVTHARYCEASLTRTFAVALGEALPFLDFCLTISAHVAEELRSFLQGNGLPPIPAVPVPLAHEMRLGPGPRRTVPHHQVEAVCRRPFVLCVCTVEARKNHAYLLAVWHRLIDEGVDVPDLVFVGRVGWRVADLMAQVEASDYLDGRLHILQGVSDSDLTLLYESCLFTAFPSFVEGWGLPVGESLSHGKLCVASSTSSIPEVGGDLCVYIDPFSLESGYRALRELIVEPEALAAREATLRARFAPRTWADLGRDFFARLDALAGDADPDALRPAAPRLRPGALLSLPKVFACAMARPDYVRNPLRLMFADGWRPPEASGTWMRGPRARLCFRTDYAEGRDAVFNLHVGASPWVTAANRLVVWAGDAPPRRSDPDGEFQAVHALGRGESPWIRVKGRVGPGGLATLHLLVEGAVAAEGANLPVAVRLHAVGYAACDDIAARIDLMESRGLYAA